MKKALIALMCSSMLASSAYAAEDWASKVEARPYLSNECILTSNPKPPANAEMAPLVAMLLAALVPKVIDFVFSSVIKAIDSASDAQVTKRSGDIYFSFFKPDKTFALLQPQPYFKCLTVVVAQFDGVDGDRTFVDKAVTPYPEAQSLRAQIGDDLIVKRLQEYGITPKLGVKNGFGKSGAAIASVYEVLLSASPDKTAFRAKSRYHLVHRHISDPKQQRAVALSISINAPGVEQDATTIAHVLLDRKKISPAKATAWGDFEDKREDGYASGWVNSVAVSKESLAAFNAAQTEYKRQSKTNKNFKPGIGEFMPVRLNVQLIETGDENKMGKFIAQVLTDIKPKAAEQLTGLILPKETDLGGAKAAACKAQIDLLSAKADQAGPAANATEAAKALASIKVENAQHTFDDAVAVLSAAGFTPENNKTYCS